MNNIHNNDYVLPPWEKAPSPEAPTINPRQLKGLYIPAKYLYSEDLTPQEKILVSFINVMDQENHCYASNKYLGYLVGVSEKTIANMLISLKAKNYVELVSFDGIKRVLKCI
jgi:hypothetical protein